MESQQDVIKKLIAKAEENTDFRKRLVADPNTALKEAFNIEVPKDFSVIVHEDDARTAHLVLPANQELTDVQLQQAAGGGLCTLGSTVLGDWC